MSIAYGWRCVRAPNCAVPSLRRRLPRTLMDWIQHDHRYPALSLELIVGIGRPEFERLFPKPKAFLALRRPGPRLHLLGPDLYLHVGVCKHVAIPAWVFGRASL